MWIMPPVGNSCYKLTSADSNAIFAHHQANGRPMGRLTILRLGFGAFRCPGTNFGRGALPRRISVSEVFLCLDDFDEVAFYGRFAMIGSHG